MVARNSLLKISQLSVAVLHREMVHELTGARNPAPLRIDSKVDTGMGRIGVLPAELPALLGDVRWAGRFQIDESCSNFAGADSVDRECSDYHLWAFRQIAESQNAYSSGAAFNGTGVHATCGPKRERRWKTEK